MRLKIDENVDARLAVVLRGAGHDSVTVSEEDLHGTDDRDLYQLCISENRALVSSISPMAEQDHDHDEGSHLSEMDLRVRAIETILVEKGYIETAALDRIIELYETKIGPHIGAQVIAKAWNDPSFRQSPTTAASP